MAAVAMHPGERLGDALRARNMSASELARRIKVPTNRVTGILNGRRAITADTALRLAHFFGTSARLWLTLQSLYDLQVAEAKTLTQIQQLPTLKHHAKFTDPSPSIATEAGGNATLVYIPEGWTRCVRRSRQDVER